MAVLSTLLSAAPSSTDATAQQHDRSDSPRIRVQVNVYEVTGKALETLKPMDLDGLKALVAESSKEKGVGTMSDGARLIASPDLTVMASRSVTARPARMDVGQTSYLSIDDFNVVPPLGSEQGHPLSEISTGVQLQLRAWFGASSEKVLLETHLRLASFEGFTEVNQSIFIPLLKVTQSEKIKLLQTGETGIFAWQEDASGTFDNPERTLTVVTITPTFSQ